MAKLFDQGTRSFAVTGTHRCFSSAKTECSGSTSVCGQGKEVILELILNFPFRLLFTVYLANNLTFRATEKPTVLMFQIHFFNFLMKQFIQNTKIHEVPQFWIKVSVETKLILPLL